MKRAYFARPINIYGSNQEKRDIELISSMGFSVAEITDSATQEKYKTRGMQVFLDMIKEREALFFRALPDCSIPAGVLLEVKQAISLDIPVLEIPSAITRRGLSVDETREYLRQVGGEMTAPTTTTICTWKWTRPTHGHQLPHVCDYSAEHVNTWARMVRRHATAGHRIVCITDDPAGITECETVPMPAPVHPGGGCFHRLWEFSEDARTVLGDRFCRMDLDCVITGNIDHIVGAAEDFRINRYLYHDKPLQYYNGALLAMDTGARRQVWERFRPASVHHVKTANRKRLVIGSDQAWISMRLGPDEATFGPETGVYEAAVIGSTLPADACIVFFSGARDPSERAFDWVDRFYY